jgi:hypothetical protein
MAACGSRGAGTRVYDIRDPLHPTEIAYWKGAAPRTAFLPGSGSWSRGVDRTVEKQAGLARFVKVPTADGKGRELNLWIVGDPVDRTMIVDERNHVRRLAHGGSTFSGVGASGKPGAVQGYQVRWG